MFLAVAICVLMSSGSVDAGQSVTLAWNANTETNLAGYRLYYGTSSRSYTQSNSVPVHLTTSTASNLSAGVTYYFAVTALASDGLESLPSDEVSYRVPGEITFSFTESLVFSPPPPRPASAPTPTEQVVQLNFGGSEVYPAGTPSPQENTGPRLQIAPVGQPAVAFRVWFETPANKECELQVSSDFQSWSQLLAFSTGAVSERLEYYDTPGTSGSRRFYRLMVR